MEPDANKADLHDALDIISRLRAENRRLNNVLDLIDSAVALSRVPVRAAVAGEEE